jgi:flagellar basal body-associated protein FliL
LSRKKKIIISVITAVLVLATVFSVAAVIGRQHDIKRAQEEYEQAQNATHKDDTTDPSDNTSSEDLPPIINPDDTGGEVIRDEITLDVSDKDRNPNPEVIDATIEYGTKEGEENHVE